MDTDKVIEALGGTRKVAKLCGLTDSAVSQWRQNGIPRPWLMFLSRECPQQFAALAETAILAAQK